MSASSGRPRKDPLAVKLLIEGAFRTAVAILKATCVALGVGCSSDSIVILGGGVGGGLSIVDVEMKESVLKSSNQRSIDFEMLSRRGCSGKENAEGLVEIEGNEAITLSSKQRSSVYHHQS